ncbi:hypothetical protein H072_6139 [Dactylellina haptotyla CBS 200.50]|uniref:Nudix hydrolase domain-containing protein n=1 Tax=Dactylellina haptotyla (strain CBS 200.50) TaxID=1284197 RepID=S8BXK6_DACHA|nr:hypothetical protein H072_6139 [Dactylellina haptotyla CBS 200.50]
MPSYYKYLDLVDQVDSFPNIATHPVAFAEKTADYSRFIHQAHTIGYIIPIVLDALKDTTLSGDWWTIAPGVVSLNGDTTEERTRNIEETTRRWREAKKFEILSGWRNEKYTVYAPKSTPCFYMERCATPLFGVLTYGAHMTVYIPATPTTPMRLWVPRRAAGKQTYPGMLDNTVAGGMGDGVGPWECIVKEAGEEASFEESYVREHAKAVGFLSYFYVRHDKAGGEIGLLQPEIEYVYDMIVKPEAEGGPVPKPFDGEVDEHMLMDVEEVKTALKQMRFKPNCAAVILDFFIRHGILTNENEPDYLEIYTRIHRRFEFPTR